MRIGLTASLCAIPVLYVRLLLTTFESSRITAAALAVWTCVPVLQMLSSIFLYLMHRRIDRVAAKAPHTVDVFVTCNNEAPDLIRASAAAARDMRGEHKTWLLDDAGNPEMERIAEELGIGYLTREGHEDAKAGNLNAALARTDGEIVAVFDIDHQPSADYLEATLPHFDDERVGFVQVAVSFRNHEASWTARASAEFAYEYYNLINVGKGTLGAATMMGSNSLLRRRALEEIGGYRPGLAEDLETSIAIHAAGWTSRYIDEPLAPGLAPEDFVSWHRQQCKWTRGVVEAAVRSLRGNFWKLTLSQKFGYLLRFSYYLTGPVTLLSIILLTWIAVTADLNFEAAVFGLLPVLAIGAVCRGAVMHFWARDPQARSASPWAAPALAVSTWTNYCRGWVAFLRQESNAFVATPKKRLNGGFLKLVRWQAGVAALLAGLLLYDLCFRMDVVLATPTAHALLLVILAAHVAIPLSIPRRVIKRLVEEPIWRRS